VEDVNYQLSAYDYELPPDLIAQTPIAPRHNSRLLVIKDRSLHTHVIFRDLPKLLHPGDLLVLNNTQVLPARLYGYKASGLPVELLLLEPQPGRSPLSDGFSDRWLALVKPGKRLKPGAEVWFSKDGQPPADLSSTVMRANILATDASTSGRIVQFEVPEGQSLRELIYQLGQMPLPPYINATTANPDQYQTVYASQPGAIAAPTAGLHFTPELLAELTDAGISQAYVTLHVGIGTFRPVEVDDITTHRMHAEWAEVPRSTVDAIRQTQAAGGRVIAVGTTVVRSLEGAAQEVTLQPFYGKVDLFIYPGYRWRVVQGLITNFHLPKSSLMMLVSALIGRERLLALYQDAIANKYRFYSFGDAMLILPEALV